MGAYSEQQVRERLLGSFVDEDPVDIALIRPVYAATVAGGETQVGTVLLPTQRFYFYPFKRRLTKEIKFNPQSYGEEKVEYADYILIFLPGVDIQAKDYFDNVGGRLEDGRYSVEFVSPRQWDRQQAGILYRG
jgi:hypothetical protein